MPDVRTSRKWTRDELLLALNLYHKLSFGQFNSSNVAVQQLATKLGRTPASVSMKLCNLAFFDLGLRQRGVNGLSGASALDRSVWDEYHADLEASVLESELKLRDVFGVADGERIEILPRSGYRIAPATSQEPTEVEAVRVERLKQGYFRNAVLNNFEGRCGVTGIGMRDLLNASHILPWSTHPAERLDVRNGICLSSLYDRAFDRYMIGFDDRCRLVVSKRVKQELGTDAYDRFFACFEGKPLLIPGESVPPSQDFLRQHLQRVAS
jgi:putative restriction endonuclease